MADYAPKRKAGEEIAAPNPLLNRRTFLIGLILILFAFPLLQVATGEFNYWMHMALFTFMYVSMASSWNIIGGFTGYISLGHNVFFAIGAYFAGLVYAYYNISPFVSAPVAGLVAMLAGLIIGLITLRTSGSTFIISTIALVFLSLFLLDKWEFAGGANGVSLELIDLPRTTAKIPFYYGMLIAMILTLFLCYHIRHSKFGLGLRAIAQDEIKAEVAGIPTNQYKIVAFALSALMVGVVGAIWGYYLTYLRPSLFLTIAIASRIVLMAILGGKGTVAGPVVGAVVLVVINEYFVAELGSTELNIVATGVIMLIVLLFFPSGIIGTLKERGRLPAFLDWEK